MKRFLFTVFLLLIAIFELHSSENGNSSQTTVRSALDICDFFLDAQPIINYDNMFGEAINSISFFTADKRQPCMNYEYTYDNTGKILSKKISHIYNDVIIYRTYTYNDKGQLDKVTERIGDFVKSLSFKFSQKGSIAEVTETMPKSSNDEYFSKYDCLKYEFNNNGCISEVRGFSSKLLGLSSSWNIIKTYDYDDNRRLKSIRDYGNPENSKIIRYDEFVKKN